MAVNVGMESRRGWTSCVLCLLLWRWDGWIPKSDIGIVGSLTLLLDYDGDDDDNDVRQRWMSRVNGKDE